MNNQENASLLSPSVKSDAPQTSPETSPQMHSGLAAHTDPGQGLQGTAPSTAGSDWEQRYKHLQSHTDRQMHELRTQLAQAQAQANAAPSTMSAEQLLGNPEVAALVERTVASQVELWKQSNDQGVAALQHDVKAMKDKAAHESIKAVHPEFDIQALLRDTAFQTWAHNLSPSSRAHLDQYLAYPQEVIELLRFYKQGQASNGATSMHGGHVPSVPTTLQQPPTGNGQVLTEAHLMDVFANQGLDTIANNLDSIQQAIGEGRFVSNT